MKKKYKYNDVTNLAIFPAEEMLRVEAGNFWSGAVKADKSNTKKQ